MSSSSSFRPTFGISGHSDIIRAYLIPLNITSLDFDNKILRFQNKDYILHTDKSVQQTLGLHGEAYCMVSFQERTTGFYALARLYRTNK